MSRTHPIRSYDGQDSADDIALALALLRVCKVATFDPDFDAASLRRHIEDRIEALLTLLDALDGDPDLEPDLGAPEANLPTIAMRFLAARFPLSQDRWADGVGDDREEDVGDEPEDTREAALGFTCGRAPR